MEIIDLKKLTNNKLEPVCKLDGKLFLRETKKVYSEDFSDLGIINYYTYEVNNKKMTKVNTQRDKIILDFFQQKTVEGQDGFYYVTVKKQILINEYTLNSVNINTSEVTTVLNYEMDKKFNSLLVEKLDEDRFIVFFKEEHTLTFEEFESFETPEENYGYDKAIIYNSRSEKNFEVKDKDFLRGLRSVFFKTYLKNEQCIVYEENYLEPYDKVQIYNDIRDGQRSKKDKFFYLDRIRYIQVKKLISEIEEGSEKLEFVNLETQGIDGYEFFAGIDGDNIYYEVNKFGKVRNDVMIILNRESIEKTSVTLLSENDADTTINSASYTWNLDGKYKVIFQKRFFPKGKLRVKEIMSGNIDYTYAEKLGYPQECISGRYLITLNIRDGQKTSIIDMQTDSVETFKSEHIVFDDDLVLF
ncbi:hypothetical protein [Clostridium sp.]|jgi:hypothetical protein|uniref:hypothetical protein n=1 Tax=Clostridium sp. TaxID=1506 RepID=UPI003EED49DC